MLFKVKTNLSYSANQSSVWIDLCKKKVLLTLSYYISPYIQNHDKFESQKCWSSLNFTRKIFEAYLATLLVCSPSNSSMLPPAFLSYDSSSPVTSLYSFSSTSPLPLPSSFHPFFFLFCFSRLSSISVSLSSISACRRASRFCSCLVVLSTIFVLKTYEFSFFFRFNNNN